MNTPPNPLVVIKDYFDKRRNEIAAALPPGMRPERFIRVVLTAIQTNPELLDASRPSLWNASMRAAQDGLLPDGREGAMVIRRDKNGAKHVQWQVMVQGLRKKIRASDEIATWDVTCVYSKDEFDFELGDQPRIYHKPHFGGDRGKLVGAYSVATFRTGEKSREVMSIEEIHQIRDRYSDGWRAYRAKKIRSTPWADAEDEMARKTVARRHSKVLPMSSDIEEILKREDEVGEPERPLGPQAVRPRLSQNALLERFANGGEDEPPATKPPALDDPGEAEEASGREIAAADAFEMGREAWSKHAGPAQWPGGWQDTALIEAWRAGWDAMASENAEGEVQ